MNKDKLTYNSKAKLGHFTTNDIGKLSINDVKNLKYLFGPKHRKNKNNTQTNNNNLTDKNGIRSSSNNMVGSSEDLPQSKNTPSSPFFRGYVPNNSLLMLENQPYPDYSRFASKSNLTIDDINKSIKDNMNPLLENIREEAKSKLIEEFSPHLENFKNTTSFINNDYMKFRDDTRRHINNLDSDIRDIYEEDIYENNNNNSIYLDDGGNFGGNKGSDSFVTLNDKNEKEENLQIPQPNYDFNPDFDNIFNQEEQQEEQEQEPEPEPEPEIDFEKIKKSEIFSQYMNSRIKINEARQLYINLGGNDDKILNAKGKGSINVVKSGISKIIKSKFNYQNKATTRDAKYKSPFI